MRSDGTWSGERRRTRYRTNAALGGRARLPCSSPNARRPSRRGLPGQGQTDRQRHVSRSTLYIHRWSASRTTTRRQARRLGSTKNVALELVPHRSWVNAIGPGGNSHPGVCAMDHPARGVRSDDPQCGGSAIQTASVAQRSTRRRSSPTCPNPHRRRRRRPARLSAASELSSRARRLLRRRQHGRSARPPARR